MDEGCPYLCIEGWPLIMEHTLTGLEMGLQQHWHQPMCWDIMSYQCVCRCSEITVCNVDSPHTRTHPHIYIYIYVPPPPVPTSSRPLAKVRLQCGHSSRALMPSICLCMTASLHASDTDEQPWDRMASSTSRWTVPPWTLRRDAHYRRIYM